MGDDIRLSVLLFVQGEFSPFGDQAHGPQFDLKALYKRGGPSKQPAFFSKGETLIWKTLYLPQAK